MDNLYFTCFNTLVLKNIIPNAHSFQPIQLSYQPSSKNIVYASQSNHIGFLNYQVKTNSLELAAQYGPIQEIVGKNIILIAYLVELQCALIVVEEGDVISVDAKSGKVEIKAQNDEGILGATISPMQDYFYIATKNRTLIQLDLQFDLVREIPIDDISELQGNSEQEVMFSWRLDGKYFVVNFGRVEGRKCLTRDLMMNVVKSPSLSDPDPQGPVQSVSEKLNSNIGKWVCWQPNGGIISGYDQVRVDQKVTRRIIHWQKNGLRHLQFILPQDLIEVKKIDWVYCRPNLHQQLLIIEGLMKDSGRSLLFYYRSNYHWYLKSVIGLAAKDSYLIIQGNRQTKLLIFRYQEGVNKAKLQTMELSLRPSEQQWKTLELEQKNPQKLFYNIDGYRLHLTDFYQNLIPPPMSQIQLDFTSCIRAVARLKQQPTIIIFLQFQVVIYSYTSKKQLRRLKIQYNQQVNISNVIYHNLQLISCEPLIFKIGKWSYKQNLQNIILFSNPIQTQTKDSQYLLNSNNQHYKITLQNNAISLSNNNNTIQLSQQCTSYAFYHQFFIFTTKSNGMYQKIIIINLMLDTWLFDDKKDIQSQIQQMDKNGLLNVRSIQRGGYILGCSKGKVILQLPRGNLQAFYPKIITIASVRKSIQSNQFRQAFQLIRTHKLDLNLLVDINYNNFLKNTVEILTKIEKVDFINLLVSQIKDQLSTQLRYCYNSDQIQQITTQFQINIKGHKISKVCSAISKSLRQINQSKYILSIFTAQIKSNHLEDVLFQIKQMRLKQIQSNVFFNLPPHLNNTDKLKIKSSQEVLEYVCWLVDAEAIYQASLLTYDLQLASMTARCTQKDPKQFIPYLEQLKAIDNLILLKKKICLDLKKYDKAIMQLAKGTQQNIQQALNLIQKHKLFKCGIQAFINNKKKLEDVKLIIINHLISNCQFNQAYNMCFSIKNFNKALEISIQQMDANKIRESYQLVQNPPKIQQIIQKVKEGMKKSDLAILYHMVGNYDQAARLYLKAGDYKNSYKLIHKISQTFIEEFIDGFKLSFSLFRNKLVKQKNEYLQKINRILIVQKNKQKTGYIRMERAKDNQDMYSQVSVSSKSASQYTISTTTGMRKKKDKKKNILSRNVKEGSPLEEEYLLAYLQDLQNKSQQNIKQAKMLTQHLIYLNLISQATLLRDQVRQYIQILKKKNLKSLAKLKFEEMHPQTIQLYYQQDKKNNLSIDSFDYFL